MENIWTLENCRQIRSQAFGVKVVEATSYIFSRSPYLRIYINSVVIFD